MLQRARYSYSSMRRSRERHLVSEGALCVAPCPAPVNQTQMKYCDMHCDALTSKGVAQVSRELLLSGGCMLQCYAAFVKEGGFARFCELADDFDARVRLENLNAVTSAAQLREGTINALLTSEGGAFERVEELTLMYERGVRMAGLVWNTPTALGYPNFPDYEGSLLGRVPLTERDGEHGLSDKGFAAVEQMFALGILVDVSHASDKLFFEVASYRKPFVASHSDAAGVYDCARNLTDEQLRMLADCGGVTGLNFCADFLSDDTSERGQRDAILEHVAHVIRVAGEDVLAIGSDFEGALQNNYLPDASHLPKLFCLIADRFGSRVAEKIAYANFLRIFSDVCG